MSMRDRLVPAVAGAAVLVVALMVIALLRSAENDGTDALEKAKVAQVRTTADSFNARVESSISSLGGLGARPWELTPGSAADQATLKTFAIDPDALSGTFLVDADDTVTNGMLLRPGMLGSTFDAAGVGEGQGGARLLAGRRPARGPLGRDDRAAELCLRRRHPGRDAHQRAWRLRLRAGTDQRLAVQPGDPGTRRRPEVHGDLAVPGQQRRRGRLHPEHRAGRPVPDARLRALPEGLHQVGDKLVVSADVPVVGWRVVFTQDRDGVRRAAGRAAAVGRPHPRPAAARRRPHPDDRARAPAAAVAGAGAPPARAQPLPGRVHLGGLPRAAHAGLRGARLPPDEPRPLGGHERRGPAQRRTPRLHQRAAPPGDDPRRPRHREHRVGSLRLRPPPDGPRRRGAHGGGRVQQRLGRRCASLDGARRPR